MKKLLSKFATSFVVFSFVLSGSGAFPLMTSAEPAEKINICHHTSSETNPWVSIEVSQNGWNGHDGHDGDYIYEGPLKGNGQGYDEWCADNDFVPPNPDSPEDGVVHILKYIDGEMATQDEESADGESFPMITPTFGDAPFTLDSDGWTTGDDPYEASTSIMEGGSTYTAYENTDTDLVGESCRENKPFALVGYTTGTSINDAEENNPSDETLEVAVDGDMYIIVWNEKCEDEEEPTQGHIVVNKVTNPAADPTSFTFTTTGTGYVGFNLTDQGAMNDQTLNAGTYSVAETATAGWTQTSATCDSTEEADTSTPGNINLSAGETVTCTFTNTKDDASPEDVTVTIVKYLDDGDDETPLVAATAANTGDESFAMTATWDAANIGSGSGDFTLGPTGFNNPTPYNATTSEMTDGADYSVVENITTACTANNDGEYVLVGYKVGDTLGGALDATLISSAYLTDITTDKFIVVVNEKCDSDTPSGDSDSADLEITKTVDDDTVNEDQNVTYTLTVTNHGPDTATNVQVNDDLPGGVSFVSADASQGSYDEDTGIWNIGTLTDDQTVTLEIEVNVEIESGEITNSANVFLNDTEDIDDNSSNDSDSVEISVEESGGGGGGSSSSSSSGSRRSSNSNSSQNEGRVLGAQISAPDEPALPEGRVLGVQVGLPYTGASNTSIYILLISFTIFIYTSAQIIRKKTY